MSKYEIDWSKLPEIEQSKIGHWWRAGQWTFDLDEEDELELCEQAIYAHLAWYLFVKEQHSGTAKA